MSMKTLSPGEIKGEKKVKFEAFYSKDRKVPPGDAGKVNKNHPNNQMMCQVPPSSCPSLTSNRHTAHSPIRKTVWLLKMHYFKNANLLNVFCRLRPQHWWRCIFLPPRTFSFPLSHHWKLHTALFCMQRYFPCSGKFYLCAVFPANATNEKWRSGPREMLRPGNWHYDVWA